MLFVIGLNVSLITFLVVFIYLKTSVDPSHDCDGEGAAKLVWWLFFGGWGVEVGCQSWRMGGSRVFRMC